jgi:hypothetical protein
MRKRIEKACEACIRAKTKCDDDRPCKVSLNSYAICVCNSLSQAFSNIASCLAHGDGDVVSPDECRYLRVSNKVFRKQLRVSIMYTTSFVQTYAQASI